MASTGVTASRCSRSGQAAAALVGKPEHNGSVRSDSGGSSALWLVASALVLGATVIAISIVAMQGHRPPSSAATRAQGSVLTAQQAIALVRPGPQDGVTRSAAKLTTWDEALTTGSPGASVPGSPEAVAARVWVVAFSVKHLRPLGLTKTADHWIAFVVDQKTGSNPAIMSGPETWPPFFDSFPKLSPGR